MSDISVSKTLRTTWNTSGYKDIVRGVLGSQYSLSIVLIGDKKSKKLNTTFRKKNYPANVLTFPLDKLSGEIYLNIPKISRDAHTFDLSAEQCAKFMLIHGCLHLKGYAHGSTMEKAEDVFLKRFVLR
jgi:probable rRNA maturation factor